MKNRLLHQLYGFLCTPPLWKDKEMFSLKQFNFPEVIFPEDIDLASEMPSISTNFVLGKRMESFFELSIQRSGYYNLMASNLQIIHNKITSGELDFLIENSVIKKSLHVELIFKFYVYDPSEKYETSRWIGPNRKDSLLRKITKLKEKQLPLLHKEETQKVLTPLNLKAENLEQEVCFKALLFLPRNSTPSLLPGMNQDCVVGYYLHLKDFKYSEFHNYQFHVPAKQDWPVDPRYNDEWISYPEVYEHVRQLHIRERSPLIWIKKNNDFDRMFVVWW